MDVQFFAYLSGQRLLRRFRPIKFNKIIENAGKCYKIATGIFEYVT